METKITVHTITALDLMEAEQGHTSLSRQPHGQWDALVTLPTGWYGTTVQGEDFGTQYGVSVSGTGDTALAAMQDAISLRARVLAGEPTIFGYHHHAGGVCPRGQHR